MFGVFAAALSSAVLAATPPQEPAPAEIARNHISHFEPAVGRWSVVNTVMKGPGVQEDLHFIVETAETLDGLGVKVDWYEAETGAFFGSIIRTYNPASGEVDQHYFAASSSNWSTTAQNIVFDEDGYHTSFSGADQYGSFDARTKTTFLPKHGGYDWTIERRYEGGDWFVIDRGEARPLPAGQ